MSNTVKTETGAEVYESKIQEYLDQYIQEHDHMDMSHETQSKWNAALLYIYKYTFKDDRDNLVYKDNRDTYNDILLNEICDIYINLCYEYDKEVSIVGFCKLTGINTDTIYDWKNGDARLGSSSIDIYKKLNRENEESLSCKLISGGTNPMKILPALNRRHNWNMPNTPTSGIEQHKSLEQIAQERGIQGITDNNSVIDIPDDDL